MTGVGHKSGRDIEEPFCTAYSTTDMAPSSVRFFN